jgi:hypothetical protein
LALALSPTRALIQSRNPDTVERKHAAQTASPHVAAVAVSSTRRVDGKSQHYESPEIVDYEDFAELTQHQGAWRSI